MGASGNSYPRSTSRTPLPLIATGFKSFFKSSTKNIFFWIMKINFKLQVKLEALIVSEIKRESWKCLEYCTLHHKAINGLKLQYYFEKDLSSNHRNTLDYNRTISQRNILPNSIYFPLIHTYINTLCSQGSFIGLLSLKQNTLWDGQLLSAFMHEKLGLRIWFAKGVQANKTQTCKLNLERSLPSKYSVPTYLKRIIFWSNTSSNLTDEKRELRICWFQK